MPANLTSTATERATLQGRRIALTINDDAVLSPADALRELDAYVLHYPVAQMLPPDSFEELDAALGRSRRGEINWILFTTPRSVEAVAERLAHLQIDPTTLKKVKIAFFGAMTRLVAEAIFPNWKSPLPHFNSHDELIDAMNLNGKSNVLVPMALHSRSNWAGLLAATRATVHAIPAYRLLVGRGGDDLPGMLWGGLVDAVIFLTENSVRHFSIRLKTEGGSLDMLGDVTIACLDPLTAAAARAYGLKVSVIPEEYTLASLVEQLARHFAGEPVNA